MNDASPPPATDELPELPSETTASGPGNRRRRRALWGALVAIAVGVGAIAVQASDDDAPRLPLALGASGAGKEAAAPGADMSMRAYVHYTAGADLPALGDDGPAYRLSDTADEAAVRRLAGAFGLDDALEREGDVWRATDGTHSMEVYPGYGAGWWFGPQDATKSSEPSVGISAGDGSDSSYACPKPLDPAGGTADACIPSTTTSTISPDLPVEDEARTIAVDVLDRAGIETDGAKVTVDGPYDGWYVIGRAGARRPAHRDDLQRDGGRRRRGPLRQWGPRRGHQGRRLRHGRHDGGDRSPQRGLRRVRRRPGTPRTARLPRRSPPTTA